MDKLLTLSENMIKTGQATRGVHLSASPPERKKMMINNLLVLLAADIQEYLQDATDKNESGTTSGSA